MCKNDILTLLKENLTLQNFSQKLTHTSQNGIDTFASFLEYQFF